MWLAKSLLSFVYEKDKSTEETGNVTVDERSDRGSIDGTENQFDNTQSSELGSEPLLQGALYRVDSTNFECMMRNCIFEFVEDEKGVSSLLASSTGEEDDEDDEANTNNQPSSRKGKAITEIEYIHFPLHLIYDFQQHLSDGFQFIVKRKKDHAEEYGVQLDTELMALKFRRTLEPHLSATAVVLVCLPCAFAVYDTIDRFFKPVAQGAKVAIAQRPADLEAFLIVKEGESNDEGPILFQDVLSPSMNLWTVPKCCQVVFWGPALMGSAESAGERRMFLVELMVEEMNDKAIEFFQLLALVLKERVDATKLTTAQKAAILQNVTDATGDSAGRRRTSQEDDSDNVGGFNGGQGMSIDEFYDYEDVEMFDTQKGLNDGTTSAVGWASSGDETEDALDSTPVYCKDPTTLARRAKPDEMLHKFMEVGSNRTFVCRGADKTNNFSDNPSVELHVYRPPNGNHAICESGIIKGDKFKYGGQKLNPTKGLLHDQESKLLMSTSTDANQVYLMDLETEQVVQKWDTEYQPVQNMIPTFKYGQSSQDPTFVCHNSKSVFYMDTRLQGTGRTTTLSYATNPQFTTAVSDMSGHLLLGSKLGTLRLYDGEKNRDGDLKRAKTQLETLKEPLKSVDVTSDGSWILCTTRAYIAVFPTRLMSSGKTGFDVSLGKSKPQARYLHLHASDIQRYGLTDIDFSPAKFSADEACIVSSTGSLAVIWDMTSIINGRPKYMLKKAENYIKDVKVSNEDNSVVVAYPGEVAVFGTGRR